MNEKVSEWVNEWKVFHDSPLHSKSLCFQETCQFPIPWLGFIKIIPESFDFIFCVLILETKKKDTSHSTLPFILPRTETQEPRHPGSGLSQSCLFLSCREIFWFRTGPCCHDLHPGMPTLTTPALLSGVLLRGNTTKSQNGPCCPPEAMHKAWECRGEHDVSALFWAEAAAPGLNGSGWSMNKAILRDRVKAKYPRRDHG